MPIEWVVGTLSGAVGVLFYALIGSYRDQIKDLKEANRQLVNEVPNLTQAVRDLTAERRAHREGQ